MLTLKTALYGEGTNIVPVFFFRERVFAVLGREGWSAQNAGRTSQVTSRDVWQMPWLDHNFEVQFYSFL